MRFCLYLKEVSVNQVWRHMPGNPSPWETEAGDLHPVCLEACRNGGRGASTQVMQETCREKPFFLLIKEKRLKENVEAICQKLRLHPVGSVMLLKIHGFYMLCDGLCMLRPGSGAIRRCGLLEWCGHVGVGFKTPILASWKPVSPSSLQMKM